MLQHTIIVRALSLKHNLGIYVIIVVVSAEQLHETESLDHDFDPIEARAVIVTLGEAALGLGVSIQRLGQLMEQTRQAPVTVTTGCKKLNLAQIENIALALGDEPVTSITTRQVPRE